jgi:hypothetical protein
MSQASPGEGIVQRGKYWGSRGHNDSVWGKRGRQGPPIATYIYYLIILGGRILWIMTIRGFLIRKDGWCIVGVGGDTESGDSWKRCPMDIGSLGLVGALSASCEP